jgi:hypothetical protein
MSQEFHREALAVLADVWALSPDVRLGQLLAHLGFLGEAHLGRGLGYIEDDELLAILYRHRGELESRFGGMQDHQSPGTGTGTSISGSSALVDASSPTESGR